MTALTVIKGGINRQRTKGAARPDVLYDLLNSYVSDEGIVVNRPGSFRIQELPAITKGICAFDESLHTFAHESVTVPDGVVLHILTHPDFEDGSENPFVLKKIHFCAPFLGFLYVVAEFDVGESGSEPVHHYWLQTGGTWQADKIYHHGDVVEPTVPNGLAYRAKRFGAPNVSWAPHVQRTIGDVIEPTVYNDFYYTVVETLGSNPASGAVEPVWPTEPGARINEDTDSGNVTPTITTPPPATTPGSDTIDRYGPPGPNQGQIP